MTDDLALSAALEREHVEIDAGLEQLGTSLATGTVAAAPFAAAAAALRRHIYLEEEFLFPPLRTGRMVASVAVMFREHGDIWHALDEVEAQIVGGAAPERVRGALDVLLELLGEHNLKEERIVYPVIDRVMAGQSAHEMRGHLAGMRPYAGWTCQALRTPA
ncbi:MAG: hemerythrin [Chloroflexi bacterium HGW-Chloroflexi-9]|nr:MAG: hemerythrin [Chloroflexi bacterium HGW-Chloroflexi-9]